MMKNPVSLVWLIGLMVCGSAIARDIGESGTQDADAPAAQEETFTDLVPGQGMLEPSNLGNLVQRGDVRAMNNVGLLWAKGYDGKQSYEEALRWWREAAKRGYTVSMNNIGLAYANGHGVPVDMKQAFDWWMQSAFQGNAWAMNAIGDCYETGEGVARDYVLAMTWYRTAADAGDVLAHYNMGSLYERGRGVERDYSESLAWYRKAAAGGDAASMWAIARFYGEGLGVEADPVEAFAWHRLAALNFKPQEIRDAQFNDSQAAKLAGRLTPEQRGRSEERMKQLKLEIVPPTSEKPLGPGEDRI